MNTEQSKNAPRIRFVISWPARLLFGFLLGVLSFASPLSAQPSIPAASAAADFPMAANAKHALAHAFARLIEQAVPLEYDKKKDWGKTKHITVGIHNKGFKLSRRKKAVNHGVWKHYRVNLIDPEKNFAVRIENLTAVDNSRVRFTLVLAARINTWARAKVYQYGIHVIALEIEGDTNVELAIDCEIGVQLHTKSGLPGLSIDPKVVAARLALMNFNIRRVSNARGPLVRELSSGLRKAVEHELKGPKLVAKINRSIDKRRDRLEIGLDDLLDSSWWPLASLPEIQKGAGDLGRENRY